MDGEELSRWVDEHSDYLHRYAYRYFRDSELANELVQDTFLAAVQGYAKFQGRAAPRTWLTGILRHKILDRIRQKSRPEPINISALEGEVESYFDENEHWTIQAGPRSWGQNPEELVGQQQFMQALNECLGKLPERARQIFMLSEAADQSREEIVTQLGLSSTNIGVILHRARLALQHCLQTNWFENAKAKG